MAPKKPLPVVRIGGTRKSSEPVTPLRIEILESSAEALFEGLAKVSQRLRALEQAFLKSVR
jgi:hypothetical protein